MKGFTLIELLAVIVILAVIALIATPIVLSIINDTKEQAVVRSAEFYVDAVENKIMQENMKLGGKLNPKECIVSTDGNITCDGTPLEIEVNGDKPDSGSITFDRGRVTGIKLTFGERKVVMNANGELVFGEIKIVTNKDEELVLVNPQPCKLIQGESNEIGSKYECEVKNGKKYNFYVLSKDLDGTTNLIMERNICEDGSLATEENKCLVPGINQTDYENAGGENWSSGDEHKYGPTTAMAYLNNATNNWYNIPNLDTTYDDESGNFTNFVLTGKARLPYHSELNSVGCEDDIEFSCPLWMADYLLDAKYDFGTIYQQNPIDGIYGYWTLSSLSGSSFSMWVGYYPGNASLTDIVNDQWFGVRPVINIKL